MTTTQTRSGHRQGDPATPTPARPFAKATKARRRPAFLGLGIALVCLSVLGAVWWANALGGTIQVTAVATDVARGEVIKAGDLTVVDLPAGPTSLKTLPATELDQLVGKVANVDLLPGSILTPASVVDQVTPPAGTSIVGVALTPAQMPTETLRAGDAARIVETPVSQGEPPAGKPLTFEATVISSTLSSAGDQTIVNVQVANADAPALAARAASGRVALILDSLEN